MNHQKTESPEKTQIDLGPGRRAFCAVSHGMAEDGKFWKFFSAEKHPKKFEEFLDFEGPGCFSNSEFMSTSLWGE